MTVPRAPRNDSTRNAVGRASSAQIAGSTLVHRNELCDIEGLYLRRTFAASCRDQRAERSMQAASPVSVSVDAYISRRIGLQFCYHDLFHRCKLACSKIDRPRLVVRQRELTACWYSYCYLSYTHHLVQSRCYLRRCFVNLKLTVLIYERIDIPRRICVFSIQQRRLVQLNTYNLGRVDPRVKGACFVESIKSRTDPAGHVKRHRRKFSFNRMRFGPRLLDGIAIPFCLLWV